MIIVGLGNPGPEYARTRHNVGYIVLDRLVSFFPGTEWRADFNVRWAKIGLHYLLAPESFMNASGHALAEFLKKKKFDFILGPDFIVVHDDLDFPLGETRLQLDRSAAGHNGVQSIIDHFGQNFARYRVGIGHNRETNIPAEDYVLQPFTPSELATIDQAVDKVAAELREKIQR